MSTHKTLTLFIFEQQQSLPDESGYLSLLQNDLATACKQNSFTVGRGVITGMLGASNSTNLKGKTQHQPDFIANDMLLDAFSWVGYLARKLCS